MTTATLPGARSLVMATVTFGRTLARALPAEEAQRIVDEIRVRRGKGSILIVLGASERPDRLDVDCVARDLSPEHAVQVLQIALARTAALHGIELSPVTPIAAADYDKLHATAERLVDRAREFGFWRHIVGGIARFFRAPATFRHPREKMIGEVLAALNERSAVE